MIELTEEQIQALATHAETPPRVFNPRTRETLVLIPRDVYERIRRFVADTNERADWDDPIFDVYDRDKA